MRVTQKEIARRLGLTQSAVSQALANHARIPKKTRDKVKQLAKELGYTPDPFLSGLSAYRKRSCSPQFQSVLGWMTNYPEEDGWSWIPTFFDYYKGAVQRAKELGYVVEKFWMRAPGMTHARMEQILKVRGVRGLILSPQPEPNFKLDFCFDQFSAVTLGQTLEEPRLHMVAFHQFRSVKIIVRKLLDLGYQRMGLAFDEKSNQRTSNAWLAAFWNEQRKLPKHNQIPFWISPNLSKDQQSFYKWFREYRPDVVLTTWNKVPQWLNQIGEGTSKSSGLALLSITHPREGISGVWENPQIIGAKAVEEVVEMLHRNERGVPQIPHSILVDGTWVQGKTVRSQLTT